MIDDFWSELNEGEIHTRDSLQFELKSEFFITPHLKHHSYKQEIYLFIPNSLQINQDTYSKQFFYLDETNLIRYKTPLMSLKELVDYGNTLSPLSRLRRMMEQTTTRLAFNEASEELKLFASIFRSRVRESVFKIVNEISENHEEESASTIYSLNREISDATHSFRHLKDILEARPENPQLIRHFNYVDEFISNTIEENLVILLKQLNSLSPETPRSNSLITQLIIKEKLYRKRKNLGPKTSKGHHFASESILYRQGLLQRFVIEALTLKHVRVSSEERHRNVLGAAAAGVAMFVYMTLLAWKASGLVINSISFIFFAAFFYVIKDRIKEGFKTLYSKRAHRWFPDYSIEITNSRGDKIGRLSENFAFVDIHQLPRNLLKIRNHRFHEELQALHRHESIIQYKREMTLNSALTKNEERRRAVTVIFRFNIHRFLQKASNPFQTQLTFDTYTQEISEKLLPKVYHLNLIIRNSWVDDKETPHVEIKAYRVVVDKNGIKRVEHIKA